MNSGMKDLKPPNLVLSKPIPVRDARFVSALSLLRGGFESCGRFGVLGLGFWALGFRVLEFRVSGFWVLGFWGFGFRVFEPLGGGLEGFRCKGLSRIEGLDVQNPQIHWVQGLGLRVLPTHPASAVLWVQPLKAGRACSTARLTRGYATPSHPRVYRGAIPRRSCSQPYSALQ